jgi:hypothetical protein
MGVICSSETSVDFQRTIERYIPEDKYAALISFFNMYYYHPYLFVGCLFSFVYNNFITVP